MSTAIDYNKELKQAIEDYNCKHLAEFEDSGYMSEFADSFVDVYNWDLLRWYQDDLSRMGYADEAIDTYGTPDSLAQLLMMGQSQYHYEKLSVAADIIRAEELEESLA